MRIIKGVHLVEGTIGKSVVTIGNFDGVHVGHREIFRLVKEQARELGAQSVAFTFRPHPQIALRPEGELPLLLSYDEKLETFGALGLDVVVEQPFSREFSTTEASSFFHDTLVKRLGAVAVVVGHDFAFGKGREAGLSALEAFCKREGVRFTIVPPFRWDGTVVSSSLIRKWVAAGEVTQAGEALGAAFFYRGIVMKGNGRGKLLGFATANLRAENKMLLPYGVYVTRSSVEGESRSFLSVTNVGVRPTFTAIDDPSHLPAVVETHLLDQDIDLYGRELRVEFLSRLRAEKRFDSKEALVRQIRDDVEAARRLDAKY